MVMDIAGGNQWDAGFVRNCYPLGQPASVAGPRCDLGRRVAAVWEGVAVSAECGVRSAECQGRVKAESRELKAETGCRFACGFRLSAFRFDYRRQQHSTDQSLGMFSHVGKRKPAVAFLRGGGRW